MIQGGIVSIEESLQQLTPKERKAAYYILQHPRDVVSLSVQRLAELANVSEATIVRLSRSLRCRGFQELKLRIAGDLAQGRTTTDAIPSPLSGGGPYDWIGTVVHNSMRLIKDTAALLPMEDVERVIHAMHCARKVAVFSTGASSEVIAEDFKRRLGHMDRWCETGHAPSAQAAVVDHLRSEDVLFGIYDDGQPAAMVPAIQRAKGNGVMVISLTRFGVNPISELADIRLFTSSLYGAKDAETASRIAPLTVLEILCMGLTSLRSTLEYASTKELVHS
jgi:DNA-binding MurR/RpiR family transcriptional regulator